MHAHRDAENDWLIQVDIDGDACRIPHARGVTPATRAVDAWERPADVTNRTGRFVYDSWLGSTKRGPSSGYDRAHRTLIPRLDRSLTDLGSSLAALGRHRWGSE